MRYFTAMNNIDSRFFLFKCLLCNSKDKEHRVVKYNYVDFLEIKKHIISNHKITKQDILELRWAKSNKFHFGIKDGRICQFYEWEVFCQNICIIRARTNNNNRMAKEKS